MGKLNLKNPKPKSHPDYTFIIIVGLLVVFGLVMLASASFDLAQAEFGDSYHYLKHQITYGLSIGLIGFLIGSLLYYNNWRKLAFILLAINILVLILVFTPLGVTAKGASRWLALGPISFQPGEIIKLTFLIYLASWISKSKFRSKSFSEGLVPFLVLLGSVMILLLLQPSTTTAIIIFTAAVIMYFASGAKIKFLISIMLLAALSLSLLIYITPYRLDRVITFINPTADRLGSGYHIDQSILAIGSGGITGVGYGESTTKLNYLPEPIGDSIFAVIAEELGFIGASLLIALFIAFTWRGFQIARKSSDIFGRLLVIGFVSTIGIQTFINIAAISGITPLTGIPLPFISFGGTALAVFLTMSGIIVNVSRYNK